MNLSIKVINNGHRHEDFKEISSGLEDEPEGGKRCFKCYRLRLLESVLYAKKITLIIFVQLFLLVHLKTQVN